ncbi:TPA: AAA family ATPase [Vibrio parahaemolyticus]|uniref:ATP-dependent nuclease n=1 Tax=Vibrio parahaemolyticus TaxID=670 RepID=UPI001DAECFDD|nr:AAA family ATPase [Vibrio parahaemolyticus]EIT7121101.1 AAA family ATPase [Vibrio vulnificus]EJB1778184.1 AAA family ATPase [Vibrio vulnificus]EJG0970775.1 AAA family ATPase [Vibrio parahaemolyticus]EJG1842402.1 AAA family ATPase [Vibrio parahaemolyticus]MDL2008893.1 AAA family ATPase [Vibrio parahaemolyticus]
MQYGESHLDRNLRNWFTNDFSCGLLRQVVLSEGRMRGLTPFSLGIDFPITAIAGKNGAGKSTLLAMICCAFHNRRNGFYPSNRRQNYYTFADFFIQHAEDVPHSGIQIDYKIAHDNWRKSKDNPGIGAFYQNRKKKRGGKWNDYSSRVSRNVVYMGIERIVPHVEKSQSKSYARSFAQGEVQGWEEEVRKVVGGILGKCYDEFKYVSHSKYRLPIVSVAGHRYSGFHMGAGENALFELFSTMHAVPQGALIVVDEIELGLHAEAQRKLIEELKKVCKKRKLQIICTTHSREVFSCLPCDARVFLESVNGKTTISKGISPDFAFSKMNDRYLVELNLLVEDDVAKALLLAVLPRSLRSRLSIEVIGSSSALSRQIASEFIRENKSNIFVVFDGDQRKLESKNINHAFKMSETLIEEDFSIWAKDHMGYLPGNTWPERWIVETAIKCEDQLASFLGTTSDELIDICKKGLQSGKHREFFTIGTELGLSREETIQRFCLHLSQSCPEMFEELKDNIAQKLL